MIGKLLAIGAVALCLAAAPPARAEKKVKRPHKVIRLDSIVVEGRIQKPEAFFLLERSNLNFGALQRTESFIPKVVKSANKAPF